MRMPAPSTLGATLGLLPGLLLALLLALPAGADEPRLADLIEANDRERALALIEQGADVNRTQGDGTSPLFWAVYHLDTELVAALLERGADPDAANSFGASPLMEAANLGKAGLVRQLLEAGADPDITNQDGQTPLMLAARRGAVDVAALLVEHGAEVDAVEGWRGQTALMWAAARAQPEMTAFLIEQGADVHRRAKAFDWASQITSEPRAQHRPTGGLTPLLYAARSGCLACVEVIVAAGADVNLPQPDGVTPLLVAIDNFAFDVAHYLLDQGADPEAWDWWGRTPLFLAVDVRTLNSRVGDATPGPEARRAALDLMRRLLEEGAHVDPQLNMHRPGRGGRNGRFRDPLLRTGATPLLRAANSHDLEAVELLLEHGARVDLPTASGVTPFMAAAGMGQARGTLGGRYTSPDVEAQSVATLRALLDGGADINARVTDVQSRLPHPPRARSTQRAGQTALHGTVRWAWSEVARFLIEQGAEVNAEDAEGNTALDLVLAKDPMEEADEHYAEVLRQAGARERDERKHISGL